MRLDRLKFPPGTVGFLPPLSVYEFEGLGDAPFDEFKKPSVILGEDRLWHSAEPSSDDGAMDKFVGDHVVFSTWQSAVQHTIDHDRTEIKEIIRVAQTDLQQVEKVQRWLNEGK